MPVETVMGTTVASAAADQQVRDFPNMEILLCIVSLCFTIFVLVLLGLYEFINFRRSRNADYQVNPEFIDTQSPSVVASTIIPLSKDERF